MNRDHVERELDRIAHDAAFGIEHFAFRVRAREELRLAAEWLARTRDASLRALRARVEDALRGLDEADARTFEALRADVASGALRGAPLRRLADAHTSYVRGSTEPHVSVEPLDALVDGLLGLPRIRETGEAPGPDLIHYEPAPASVVLALADMLATSPTDVVCDVGSGAGRIPLFFHLLTGVRTLGVELDEDLSRIAEHARASLALDGVRFVTADARAAEFQGASVFVLVTPFKGRVLEDVLERLRASQEGRALRLVSFGPGTPWVARTPWLSLVDGDPNDEFRLARFESR